MNTTKQKLAKATMKKIMISALALVGLLLGACGKEEGGGGKQEVTPSNLIVSLSAPATYAPIGTDDGTPQESAINNVELYIFNSDGTPDGINPYVRKSPVTLSDKLNVLVAAGSKKILVAANIELGYTTNDTYAITKARLDKVKLDQGSSRVFPTGGLEMSGETSTTVSANVPDNRVSVTISRLVTKVKAPVTTGIVVELDAEDQEEILPGTTSIPTFEFLGYALINGQDHSDAFTNWNSGMNENATWDTWTSKNYQKTTFDGQDDIDIAYSGDHNNSPWLDGTAASTSEFIYVYENSPERKIDDYGYAYYVQDKTYAFLVKGKLTADGEDAIRYWRVNLVKSESYKILRNSIYNVRLTKIVSKGYGTAKEAEEDKDGGGVVPEPGQTGILMDIDIQPWRIFETEDEM